MTKFYLGLILFSAYVIDDKIHIVSTDYTVLIGTHALLDSVISNKL